MPELSAIFRDFYSAGIQSRGFWDLSVLLSYQSGSQQVNMRSFSLHCHLRVGVVLVLMIGGADWFASPPLLWTVLLIPSGCLRIKDQCISSPWHYLEVMHRLQPQSRSDTNIACWCFYTSFCQTAPARTAWTWVLLGFWKQSEAAGTGVLGRPCQGQNKFQNWSQKDSPTSKSVQCVVSSQPLIDSVVGGVIRSGALWQSSKLVTLGPIKFRSGTGLPDCVASKRRARWLITFKICTNQKSANLQQLTLNC